MTREEILAMEAGEKLDKLVAVQVMGELMPEFVPENALGLQLTGNPVKSPKGNWMCLCRYEEGDIPTWYPLSYSTDISAAWQVVEKLIDEGKGFDVGSTIYGSNLDKFFCKFYDVAQNRYFITATYVALGRTAPEAICKAALLEKLGGKGVK